MAKTVYFLGAGVNRTLTNDGGLPPPLDGDFLQLLAKQGEALPGEHIPGKNRSFHHGLRPGGQVPPLDQASEAGNIYWVYDLVRRFWHKSPQDLTREQFSLEELLTFLQLKQNDTGGRNRTGPGSGLQPTEALFCELVLEHRLLTYLAGFSDIAKSKTYMTVFAESICREKATVISTNYDTIVETVKDYASNSAGGSVGNLTTQAWDMRSAYCIGFNEPGSGMRMTRPKCVYPQVLKLHGSLNWQSLIDVTSGTRRIADLVFFDNKSFRARPFTYLNTSRDMGARMLLAPLIVPMMLYKDKYYRHRKIRSVWNAARRAMSECERLIVIGYSLPPTDFHVKSLFLDALFERNLRELVIVNPDTSVIQRIKDVTHFRRPVKVCRDIMEFAQCND